MKIKKGELYYNTQEGVLEIPMSDMEVDEGVLTDKIAVYCPTEDDWDYVNKVKGWNWDYSEIYSIRMLNDARFRLTCVQEAEQKGYHVITIDQFKEFYPPVVEQDEYSWVSNGMQNIPVKETFNPQPHYDNSRGSLYKVATELNLNHWEFDIFKRLVRCRKKGQFKQDLQKIKDTIDIYINEHDRNIKC